MARRKFSRTGGRTPGYLNYYLRHLVIGQKKNFLGGNWKGFAASNCNDFPSLISPFISGRESQNESFPRTHNLGERTRQVWQDNNVVSNSL